MTHLVLSICGIFLFLFFLSFLFPKKKSTVHGSAKLLSKNKHLSRWNKGFWIGSRKMTRKLSFQHMLLLASTGQGKTQFVIAKCLNHLARKNSVICMDPKGELTKLGSGYCRDKLKADVFVLDLAHPQKSIQWNPFHSVELHDIQGLMTNLYDIVNDDPKVEAIWKYGACDVLTNIGKVLYIYEDGEYLNLANLSYVLNHLQVSPEQITAWAKRHAPDEESRLFFDRFQATDEKVKNGQLAGAISSIVPYCSEQVKQITSGHSLPDLCSFRKKKSVLFLCTPLSQDASYAPFITLFMSRFLGQVLKDEIQESDLSLAVILEEMGNLLAIKSYDTVVSTVRDKRVMLLHCLQNLDQLSATYGDKKAEIIANNCGSWVILPGIKSEHTLSYITKSLLGSSTVEHYDHRKHAIVTTARPLMTPDEVRRMKDGTGLFISGNDHPVLLRFRPLYKSWWLRWKYGLRNKKGRLVSKYASVTHVSSQQELKYISFKPASSQDAEQTRFEHLMRKHFPDNPA